MVHLAGFLMTMEAMTNDRLSTNERTDVQTYGLTGKTLPMDFMHRIPDLPRIPPTGFGSSSSIKSEVNMSWPDRARWLAGWLVRFLNPREWMGRCESDSAWLVRQVGISAVFYILRGDELTLTAY